jgi:hypothetical protein
MFTAAIDKDGYKIAKRDNSFKCFACELESIQNLSLKFHPNNHDLNGTENRTLVATKVLRNGATQHSYGFRFNFFDNKQSCQCNIHGS